MALPSAATVENLTRCKALPGFFPGGYVDQFLRKLPFESVLLTVIVSASV